MITKINRILCFKPQPHLWIKYIIYLFILMPICFCSAQESKSTQSLNKNNIASNIKNDAQNLLKKAYKVEHDDPQLSVSYAKHALIAAEKEKKALVQANAHVLLAKIAKKNKQYNTSSSHFISAISIFRRIDKKEKFIESTINLAEVFILDSKYDQAFRSIKTALKHANEIKNYELSIKSISAYGDNLYHKKIYIDAIEKYNEALDLYTLVKLNKPKIMAGLWSKIARAYKKMEDHIQSKKYFSKALKKYTEIDEKKQIAKHLDYLATEERQLGNYINALDFSLRALKRQKELGDSSRTAKNLLNIGIIYRLMDSFDDSLNYLTQAHNIQVLRNDINGIAVTTNETGLIYTRLNQPANARDFYQKTLDLPKHKINSSYRAAALREMSKIDLENSHYDTAMSLAKEAQLIYTDNNNIGKNASISRIIGEIYQAMGDKKRAIENYNESLHLAKKIKSDWKEAIALNRLGRIFLDDNTDKSIKLLEKSLSLSKRFTDKSVTIKNYSILKQAETKRKNHKKALYYANLELELTNIIHQKNANMDLDKMKLLLNSKKKEAELKDLEETSKKNKRDLDKKSSELEILNQEKEITQLKLAQKTYASVALLTTLLLSITILIFIYRRFLKSKHQQVILDNKNSDLERTNENKDRLFSILAHDLRSPIASVISLCDLVKGDFHQYSKDQLYNIIDKIHLSSATTYTLLNNLLEWAANQLIQAAPSPTSISALTLCENAIDEAYVSAETKNITIINTVHADDLIYADTTMLSTCLRNILSNAIKFTPTSGCIYIRTRKMGYLIEISIKDTGIGMNKNTIEMLFTDKKNTATKGTNGEQGFGLGLTLCKELVEKNNGTIKARSEEGSGSEFIITLPRKKTP